MLLNETVERLNKEYEKTKGTTIQQCSIELYEVSDSYDSKQVIQNIKTYAENHKGVTYVIAFHDSDYYSENTFDSHKRLVGVKGQKKSSHYHIGMTFPYRIILNDLAIALGIEDRWIMKVKKDSLMDGLYWYYTHLQYDESEKHHYDYKLFDTNIPDYLEYIINMYKTKLYVKQSDIITNFIQSIISIDTMISYVQFYKILYGLDYTLSEIKQYYQQLKDLLIEHNNEIALKIESQQDDMARKRFQKMVNEKMLSDHTCKLVDEFGTVVIENDNGKKYVLTNALVKEKKKK